MSKYKLTLFYLISFFIVIISLGCADENSTGQLSSASKTTCIKHLNTTCSTCHYLARVCQQLDNKSKGKWKRTIKRMVQKGAKLTEQEQEALVNCLHKPPASIREICK